MSDTAVVLIDATAVPLNRAGVGRYVDSLVAALDGPLVIACQAHDAAHYEALAPSALVLPQHGIRSVWRRLLWEQFSLPRVARAAGATVVHSPHYTMPLLSSLPHVVSFHDAIFFSDPAVHTRAKGIFFRTWIRWSRRRAAAIQVPSRATADQLTKYIGTPARGDYTVIHLGVDLDQFRPPGEAEVSEVRDRIAHGARPWIAFLGTIEPRKNLIELVRAYADLAAHWEGKREELPVLAIAGSDGWGVDLTPHLAAVPPPGDIVRLGYLELELVHAYLGGALATAYPSLGEGFGFPVLEAMACGSPVITTRRLSLPEVGGEAVFYTDVDAASIRDAMSTLIEDPDLRAHLAALARERAQQFSWTACAAAHRALYDQAAADPR